MKGFKYLPILLIFSLLSASWTNESYSYEIGQFVSDFKLYNVSEDTIFNLYEYQNEKAVLIIFDANDCAYSNYYNERLQKIYDRYESKGLKFLFINSFNSRIKPNESRAMMQERSDLRKIKAPYLHDKNRAIAHKFGATKTPEVYLLHIEHSKFVLKYKGAIDDNAQVASDVDTPYLENALEALFSGEKIAHPVTNTIGCRIQ